MNGSPSIEKKVCFTPMGIKCYAVKFGSILSAKPPEFSVPSLEKKRKKLRRKNEKLDKKSFEKCRGANSDIAAVMTFLVAPIIVIILVILIAEYM